jgi:salicylate hydroxylase
VTADRVLIAGAGIGGLTAALALARRGIGVALFDQAEKLEEAGAGLQLSPNAAQVLIGLGLADRLEPATVAPTAVRLRFGPDGRDIAMIPLGATAQARYGAPYWVIHRADLQRALLEAVMAEPRIALTLGAKVEGFTIDASGAHAAILYGGAKTPADQSGTALIGADGLWSRLCARLGDSEPPRFAGRSAFRAVVPAAQLPPPCREPVVNLWLGANGHVVHYPIRAGAAVNIVAVAADPWQSPAWSTAVDRGEVMRRFPASAWT